MTESPNRLLLQTVWPFVFTILVLVVTMIFSLELTSAVRAYVGGESLWSKSQKQAIIALTNYIHTRSDRDYQNYLTDISVPLGDHKARLALNQKNPDMDSAYNGFIQGKNNPEDIPGMINLYRYFGDTSLMKGPIRIWAKADTYILKMQSIGKLLYKLNSRGQMNDIEIHHKMMRKLNKINSEVTPLEELFSSSIAKVSRKIDYIITTLLISLTLLLTGLGIWFSRRLAIQRLASTHALEKESQKNLAFLRNASDGIHILDPDGNIHEASDSFCTMLGYSRNEIIRMNVTQWDAHFSPEDFPGRMRTAIDGGVRDEFETVHRRKDGALFDVEVSVFPIILDGHSLLFCSSRDISERKCAETRIEQDREQQTILRELLEISLVPSALNTLLKRCLDRLMLTSWLSKLPQSGIFLLEDDEKYQSLKLVASHAFSTRVKTLCAQVAPGQCLCGQAAISGQLQYANCVDERHTIHYEGMMEHGHYNVPLKSGDKVIGVLVLYLPVDYQRNPQHEQFINSVSDILAGLISRKQAEQALIAHQAQLETLVETRTAELLAAKDAAESASRAKSAFLANMSHELRTPLQTIIGAEHMLRLDPLSPQQALWLDRQQAAGAHLLDVINDILDLSQIEADKIVLEDKPLDVLSILQDVAKLIESRAQSKGLQIKLEVQNLTSRLIGDAGRLRQALLNYAGNAVKFTDQGEILIRSSLVDEDTASAMIRFEVIDQGIGIAADAISRLFSAFEQADNSLTRQYGGTGLGLAITKEIAQLMGGDAGVESREGQGSTFWFTVRLHKDHEQVAESAKNYLVEEESADTLLSTHYAGKKVLVAEDEPINQSLFCEILKQVNLDVTIAEDGERAVTLAAEQRFDIILMDMQMPRLDGLAATRQIRQMPNNALVPILAMTGNAFAEDRERCLNLGMNDFITKPVSPQVLYLTIAAWLTGRVN